MVRPRAVRSPDPRIRPLGPRPALRRLRLRFIDRQIIAILPEPIKADPGVPTGDGPSRDRVRAFLLGRRHPDRAAADRSSRRTVTRSGSRPERRRRRRGSRAVHAAGARRIVSGSAKRPAPPPTAPRRHFPPGRRRRHSPVCDDSRRHPFALVGGRMNALSDGAGVVGGRSSSRSPCSSRSAALRARPTAPSPPRRPSRRATLRRGPVARPAASHDARGRAPLVRRQEARGPAFRARHHGSAEIGTGSA